MKDSKNPTKGSKKKKENHDPLLKFASILDGVTLFGNGQIPRLMSQLSSTVAPWTLYFSAIATTSLCSRRALPPVPPSGE